MKAVRGFFMFWYDFFVGDAWELAAGTVIALVLAAVLASSAASGIAWLIFPVCVLAALTISVWWYARSHKPTVPAPAAAPKK